MDTTISLYSFELVLIQGGRGDVPNILGQLYTENIKIPQCLPATINVASLVDKSKSTVMCLKCIPRVRTGQERLANESPLSWAPVILEVFRDLCSMHFKEAGFR